MAERNALMPYWEGTKMAANHLVGGAMDNDVVERTTMFPLGKYSDGHVRPAWPGIISAPFEGFNSMWERGDEANVLNPESLRQSSEESFDAAGLAATGGLAAGALGAVPEGAIAANGWGQKLKGWLGRNAEPIGSPPPESLSMSMSDSSGSQPNGLLRFGDWRAGQSSAEPAGVGRAFGAGRYQLARAPGRDHGDDLAFQILRDGDDFGTLDVRQIGPDSAHVIKMETSDGSNSVGLAGLRELREAFRDFEPSVTRFSGTRDNQFKTGSALDGFRSSGRAVERPQVLDLYSNSPTSAAAPLAFTDNEDQRNALMSPRHHSSGQTRNASGQFSK